jgi:rod shape-determining protein MreC
VCLELICIWVIASQNIFLGASFFNSSNSAVAKVLASSHAINHYFALGDVNKDLSEENAQLRLRLKAYEQSLYRLDTRVIKDPDLIGQYEFVSAKVINNNIHNVHNHITINVGTKEGMERGMGVVNQYGVVGKVLTVSANYSVISSLLNADLMISSKIKRTGHLGTTNWNGSDIKQANLLYIPRHVVPVLGDTIITTGYNTVFPEGIIIGTVDELSLADEANFYNIEVKLANDFGKISHVYVVKNNLKEEQESTEKLVVGIHD